MAKEFYTAEEAMKMLALNKSELSNLVRESKIREFRVEGQVKYKATEIDNLALELNPAGAGLGSGSQLSDSGSQSAFDLAPADTTDGGTDVISLDDSSSGEQMVPPKTPGKGKDDMVMTPAGVSVFDEDELSGIDADPMAKTQIAPSVTDELSLEGGSGGGSGSGLLDMTRENDDTSLGAELLDEIYSGEETKADKAAQVEAPGEAFANVEEPAVTSRMVVQVSDPWFGLFSGLLVAAAILLAFSGLVAAALVAGTLPGFIAWLASKIFIWIIIALVVALAGAGLGYVLGNRVPS